ncbi:hypothetical protein GCM10023206_01070 [Acinetobacter puyangensis]|uniref:hypothetical protein n=1 Tax=Acinetobacter puyangensis TaxID=1096779 RepID=UPI00148DE9E7|nr:hypothetical protein [Acinetobacter puyangensis]
MKNIIQKEIVDTLVKYPQVTAFLPLKVITVDMTILFDEYGNVLKAGDLRPW